MKYRNEIMKFQKKNSGISEKHLLFTIIAGRTGKFTDDSVYEPLLKSDEEE